MAPREANNTFADQFLCMDFDGIGMLPNDPAPPGGGLAAAVAAAVMMEGGGNGGAGLTGAGGEDEDDQAAADAAAVVAQQVLDNMTIGGGGDGGGGAAGNTSSTTHSNTDDANSQQNQQGDAIPEPVDPLSIDPTQTTSEDEGDYNHPHLPPSSMMDGITSTTTIGSSPSPPPPTHLYVTAGGRSFASQIEDDVQPYLGSMATTRSHTAASSVLSSDYLDGYPMGGETGDGPFTIASPPRPVRLSSNSQSSGSMMDGPNHVTPHRPPNGTATTATYHYHPFGTSPHNNGSGSFGDNSSSPISNHSEGSLSTNISTNNHQHSNLSSSLLHGAAASGGVTSANANYSANQSDRPSLVRRLVSQASQGSLGASGMSNTFHSGISVDLSASSTTEEGGPSITPLSLHLDHSMDEDEDDDDDVNVNHNSHIPRLHHSGTSGSVILPSSSHRRVSLIRRSATSGTSGNSGSNHHHSGAGYHVISSPAPEPLNHSRRSMSAGPVSLTGPNSGSLSVPPLPASPSHRTSGSPATPQLLSFGPNTTLKDLQYFAERGCIVALLGSLNTPKLTAQGARLLADYAKDPRRRSAVAKNKRILEFTLRTMHGYVGHPDRPSVPYNHTEEERQCRERAVEYAVETIRSLTATEESDGPLLGTPGLLLGLAAMAKGGHIGVTAHQENIKRLSQGSMTGNSGPSAANGGYPIWSSPSPRRVSDLSTMHHNPYQHPQQQSGSYQQDPRNIASGYGVVHSPRRPMPPQHNHQHLPHYGGSGSVSGGGYQVPNISRSNSSGTELGNMMSQPPRPPQPPAVSEPSPVSLFGWSSTPPPPPPSSSSVILSRRSSSHDNGAAPNAIPHSGGGVATTASSSFGSLKPPTPADFSDWPVMNSKTRLHACIAIMNLSCGKQNKVEIAKVPDILLAMRHVMMAPPLDGPGSDPNALRALTTSSNAAQHLQESRLKAATCIKNLSNHDGNDPHLLHTPGLLESLGHVIIISIKHIQSLQEKLAESDPEQLEEAQQTDMATQKRRCTVTVTNACLALMNLSINKANKHRVFLSQGIMEALMMVLDTSVSSTTDKQGEVVAAPLAGAEARIKACSALSNLAIGYDNKIPMFHYPGFVDTILKVIKNDDGEARTKCCSILWSFAAEMRNQVPVVSRGDILPVLVKVAEDDLRTEARFKCVAALTLLAESLENAVPILESGALHPLMDILSEAGPDPTQWQGQTASWCVGFLMNIAQSDDAVESLRNAGVVELLAPLLTLDHYQSLKAAMAVTFVCRYDEDDSTYDLLRKTESVIPKICSLLTNTLAGKGGNGYKYGVFTLRSSVGCIGSLASGPVFMKERMATGPVYESLLKVVSDFCVDMTEGAIVGGGRDDAYSATLAVQALKDLTGYLKPSPLSQFPFGPLMEERLITALGNFEQSTHPGVTPKAKQWAMDTRLLLMGYSNQQNDAEEELLLNMAMAPANFCCSIERMCSPSPTMNPFAQVVHPMAAAMMGASGGSSNNSNNNDVSDSSNSNVSNSRRAMAAAARRSAGLSGGVLDMDVSGTSIDGDSSGQESAGETASATSSRKGGTAASTVTLPSTSNAQPVRTFLLSDKQTGRRFAVPIDPSGGRRFNDQRPWCFRRGRFCLDGEQPDPNFVWTLELEQAYQAALRTQEEANRRKQEEAAAAAKKQQTRTRSFFC